MVWITFGFGKMDEQCSDVIHTIHATMDVLEREVAGGQSAPGAKRSYYSVLTYLPLVLF